MILRGRGGPGPGSTAPRSSQVAPGLRAPRSSLGAGLAARCPRAPQTAPWGWVARGAVGRSRALREDSRRPGLRPREDSTPAPQQGRSNASDGQRSPHPRVQGEDGCSARCYRPGACPGRPPPQPRGGHPGVPRAPSGGDAEAGRRAHACRESPAHPPARGSPERRALLRRDPRAARPPEAGPPTAAALPPPPRARPPHPRARPPALGSRAWPRRGPRPAPSPDSPRGMRPQATHPGGGRPCQRVGG